MEDQQKYTLAEIRGYLTVLLAMEESSGCIDEAEGLTAMKNFNTLITVLSDPLAVEVFKAIIKRKDQEDGNTQEDVIAEILQQVACKSTN